MDQENGNITNNNSHSITTNTLLKIQINSFIAQIINKSPIIKRKKQITKKKNNK